MGETIPTPDQNPEHDHPVEHGHDHDHSHHHHDHGGGGGRMIKSKLLLLLGIAVATVLLCYMFLFQVGPNEMALLTTFGKIDEKSNIIEPGLKTRLPWPFQQVVKYSTRLQLTEAPLAQVQTKDGYSIVVRTFINWRVSDPVKFYNNVGDFSKVPDRLIPSINSATGLFGKYEFSQIVSTKAGDLKLDEIEKKALEHIRAALAKLDENGGYGIDVTHFGIRRQVLPPQVTAKVFERMKSDRQRRAAFIRSQGKADASAIEKEAIAQSESILAFADRHAEEIRTKGRTEAAKVYKEFAKDEEFAIFLEELEAIKVMLANKLTVIIDVNQLTPGHPLYRLSPKANKNVGPQPGGGE